jgi:hypothetical protein
MTTAEAIDSIPEIVSKAIPITFDYITCPAKRAVAVENAKWRRERLADALKIMIIRLQDNKTSAKTGMSVDLLEKVAGQFCVVTFDTDNEEEAVGHAKLLNNAFVLDRLNWDVVYGRDANL